MECGLSPDEFWDMSWYELSLISKRARYQMENQWNHTRHLIAVHTSKSAREIMPLSMDTVKGKITTQADAQRILERYKHHLTPKDE